MARYKFEVPKPKWRAPENPASSAISRVRLLADLKAAEAMDEERERLRKRREQIFGLITPNTKALIYEVGCAVRAEILRTHSLDLK